MKNFLHLTGRVFERMTQVASTGLLKELTKAVIERCLETELDMHLGYPKHGHQSNATGNTRKGHNQKTLKGEQGHVEIELPRDRHGSSLPAPGQKGANALGRLR